MSEIQLALETVCVRLGADREKQALIEHPIGFRIIGKSGGEWTLHSKPEPRLVDGCATADCTIELDAESFAMIIEGKRNLQEAYAEGLLKVSGDRRGLLSIVALFTK